MSALERIRRFDTALLSAMRSRGHNPHLDRAVAAYSRLGQHSRLWLAIAAAGAASQPHRRAVYLRAVRALVAAEVTTAVAKRVVRRARPSLVHLPALTPVPSPLSYPSAHASTSFAAARVLAVALPAGQVYGAAALMACSRPYLGVHYPSDIVAGMLLGAALAELVP
jgi:membrane-associated phospholipid phosphatase